MTILMPCPFGLHFCDESQQCEEPANSKCVEKLTKRLVEIKDYNTKGSFHPCKDFVQEIEDEIIYWELSWGRQKRSKRQAKRQRGKLSAIVGKWIWMEWMGFTK